MVRKINTQPIRHKWEDSAGYTWFFEIDFRSRGDRAIPVRFEIRGRGDNELTQRAIREFPFRLQALGGRGLGGRQRIELMKATMDLTKEMATYRFKRGHRGASRLTPEEIELTCAVFMEALQTGRPLVKTVARCFNISESAANKRIMKLRKEGLLPRSERRRRTRERP